MYLTVVILQNKEGFIIILLFITHCKNVMFYSKQFIYIRHR